MSAIFGVTKENWKARYLGLDFIQPQKNETLIVTPFYRDEATNRYSQSSFNRLTQYFIDGVTKQSIGYFSIDGDSYNNRFDLHSTPGEAGRDMSAIDFEREIALAYSQQADKENKGTCEALVYVSKIHEQLTAKGIKLDSLNIRHDNNFTNTEVNSTLTLTYVDNNILITVGVNLGTLNTENALASVQEVIGDYYLLPDANRHATIHYGRATVAKEIGDELKALFTVSSYAMHPDDSPVTDDRKEIQVSDEQLIDYLNGARHIEPVEGAKLIRAILGKLNAGKIFSIARTLDNNQASLNIRSAVGTREYTITVDL